MCGKSEDSRKQCDTHRGNTSSCRPHGEGEYALSFSSSPFKLFEFFFCHQPSTSEFLVLSFSPSLSPFLSLSLSLTLFHSHSHSLYPPPPLSLSLSLSLSLYPSLCLSVYLCLSICLSLYFSLCSLLQTVASLQGSILLLQASDLRGAESDATESFYASLNPTKCKNLSTRRVLNNSKQDLVCERDETLYEIVEEINYFMLP